MDFPHSILLCMVGYMHVCVVCYSTTCYTGATVLTTGPRPLTWKVGSKLGVTCLHPLPPSPSLPQHLMVSTVRFLCHCKYVSFIWAFDLACICLLGLIKCPILISFLFSVKNMSELTHLRQTPSPSMQSYGGYGTDHGRLVQIFSKCKLSITWSCCENRSKGGKWSFFVNLTVAFKNRHWKTKMSPYNLTVNFYYTEMSFHCELKSLLSCLPCDYMFGSTILLEQSYFRSPLLYLIMVTLLFVEF